MESIEQMIKRLCPKGVEYVKLGEVCDVLRGKRLTKKELFEDAKYKVFHGGLSPIGYYTKSNRQAQTVILSKTILLPICYVICMFINK